MKAIVRSAIAARRKFKAAFDADAKFQTLMVERYGEHFERPDSIVEVYANGMNQDITLEWLDEQMAANGILPISKATKS